jgi:hypothetical protein
MELLKAGADPLDAAIAGAAKDGKLSAGVSFVALGKNGQFAGLGLNEPARIAVHDGDSARVLECEVLNA